MNLEERERVFEQALEDYRAGRLTMATKSLGRLVESGSRDPAHLSYYGLLRAFTAGPDDEGIELCRRAVEKDGRRTSLLYLNLARALAAQGRRREAIDALERGVVVHRDDRKLRRELQHLVPRRRPLFSSLDRRHPLNKCYGLARALGGRVWLSLRPWRRRSV